MNNIITGFNRGVRDATPAGVDVVGRSNYFQGNGSNGIVSADDITRPAGTPLFVDAANGNYYLVDSSPALDSSLDQLEDRFDYITFKTELGIAISTIDAPLRDVYGQLRISSSQIPGGGGSTQFIDRGAVDRSDFEKPFAQLLRPIDHLNTQREDRDPNPTVVHLRQPILDHFSILLGDGRGPNAPFEGTGVDPATVDAASVTVRRNNITLTEGVDFRLAYNALTGELRLTPFSTLWAPGAVYEILLDNTLITDNAGNRLQGNQADGSTRFAILLPEIGLDFGDAETGKSYATALHNNAARHALIDGALPRLGKIVDAEHDSAATIGGSDDAPRAVLASSPTGSPIFMINALPAVNGQSIEISATPPSPHAQLSIDIGNGATLFELVPDGIAPSVGAIAVRYTAGDSPEAIASHLTAAITTALSSPGDSLVVARPDPTNQAAITIYNLDDEDGVNVGLYNDGLRDYIVFLQPGIEGTTSNNKDVLGFLNPLDQAGTQIPVSVTGSGYVSAWIDFDGDGLFHPTLEKVIDNVFVTDTGEPTIFTVNTPLGTTDKVTWARFRISPEGGLQPSGLAIGGEVEDYQVQIINVPLPVPVDDPVAASTHYTIKEHEKLDTADADNLIPSLLDNDVIHPGTFTPVTVVLGQDVANGTLELDSETGDFVYTPLTNFVGIDTFTYRLATQQAAIDALSPPPLFATVTIEVQPVNDPPLAQDQTIVALEDVVRTVTEAELLVNAQAHASPSYPPGAPTAPWDESNQVLHVVALHVGPLTIDASTPSTAFPIATPRGQILSATFNTSDPSDHFLESFEYRSNQDVNRDNLRPASGPPIFDQIAYTISDDGLSDDPNVLDDGGVDDQIGVFDSDNGRLTDTKLVLFDVRPQNDDPVANPDSISKDSPRWLTYWSVLGLSTPVPTENEPLTIPFAFLLGNDANAPATAADELAHYNDGDLSILDPGTTLSTTLGGTVTF
ncbi:MAG: GEVED domain-containing protein, partial [Novipirellula sp. JB048]